MVDLIACLRAGPNSVSGEAIKGQAASVPGRTAGADIATVEDLEQVGTGDIVDPEVAIEGRVITSKRVQSISKRGQRRQLSPGV